MSLPKLPLEFKNFRAWVKIDGQEADCFARDIDKRERVASCWVASQVGKTFSIHFKKEETNSNCRVSVMIDGKTVGSSICRKHEGTSCEWQTINTSKTTKRPYIFAPMSLTDDEASVESSLLNKSTKKLGEITIKIYRITRLIYKLSERCGTPSDDEEKEDESIPDVQKVHEASKKATSVPHQMAYGEKIERKSMENDSDEDCNESTMVTTMFYDEKERLATFTFRYRPLDALLLCGIAPRGSTLPYVELVTDGPGNPGAEAVAATPPLAMEPEVNNSVTSRPSVHPPQLSAAAGTQNEALKMEPEEESFSLYDCKEEDNDSEEEKLLLAALETVRYRKRKNAENVNNTRKSVKREIIGQPCFASGEVIDLT